MKMQSAPVPFPALFSSFATTKIELAVLALTMVAVSGCHRHDRVVRFIIPDGFTGYFWIVPSNDVQNQPARKGSIVTVVVPPDRIVRTKDAGFLDEWHKEDAYTKSGKKIPVYDMDNASATDVVLREFSTDARGITTYMVGTQAYIEANYKGTEDSDKKLKEALSRSKKHPATAR